MGGPGQGGVARGAGVGSGASGVGAERGEQTERRGFLGQGDCSV